MAIKGAVMLPHSAKIIKNINKSAFDELIDMYFKAVRFILNKKPQTIVIISPHTTLYLDYFHISLGKEANATIQVNNDKTEVISINYDCDFISRLSSKTQENKISFGVFGEKNRTLDKGCYVPLWFLKNCGQAMSDNIKFVRIGVSALPQSEHYRLGTLIKTTAEELNKDVVVIASGGLSSNYTQAEKFENNGNRFDRQIMKIMTRARFDKLFEFPEELCDDAKECGHRSFTALAGCFDGYAVTTGNLYYDIIDKKGYGLCTFEPGVRDSKRRFLMQYEEKIEKQIKKLKSVDDEYIRLAKKATEEYVLYKNVIGIPEGTSEALKYKRAGVFVFIQEEGLLRGCFGTTYPSTACIAQEIIRSAVYASGHDPRFKPIRPEELKYLSYRVYTVNNVEKITSKSQLDVDKYGIIVTRGMKQALLLPKTDGIESIDEQLSIARQKAKIGENDEVILQRFTVEEHR